MVSDPANLNPPPTIHRPASTTHHPLVYLYGFSAGASRLQPAASGIEEGVGVECIEHQGIGAWVSLVPAAAYEEQPLEEHLKDPRWLALRVERHNHVLLGILEHTAVAPCRFGMLYRSVAAVRDVIARHRQPLLRTLRRLQGRAEWSVKAHMAPHSIRNPQSAIRNQEGAAYLLGLVQKRARERDSSRRVHDHARRICAALEKLAEEIAFLPLRDCQNGKGTIFLNLACLVKQSDHQALVSSLAKLAAKEKKRHIALTWSGPWPAYSFAAAAFPPMPICSGP